MSSSSRTNLVPLASQPNLLRNGGFSVGSAFWTLSGATLGTYAVDLSLQTSDSATIRQDFGALPLSFGVPAAPGDLGSLASGYAGAQDVLIPPGPYSLSLDIDPAQGEAAVTVEANTPIVFTGAATQSTVSRTRMTFQFTSADPITWVQIRVTRLSTLLEARVQRVSLAAGETQDLPYLIDPFEACFPAGSIVLSAGAVCPAGFEVLPDTLSPLPEWSAANPGAQGMLGNFVRSSQAQSGTEKHTGTANTTLSAEDTVDLPGPNNPDALAVTAKDFQNPQLDSGDHTHDLGPAGTRPVSRAFTLCRRLG